MDSIQDDLANSDWTVERRERYYPGPPDTAGGIGHVMEVVTPVMVATLPLAMSILPWLFPDEGRALGARIKSGLGAKQFYSSWRRSCAKTNISPAPLDFPSFLQPTIEGLCLLDALSCRSNSEQTFRIASVVSSAHDFASAAHPSGPGVYRTIITSNQATYAYHINGWGRGVKETQSSHRRWHSRLEVDLA